MAGKLGDGSYQTVSALTGTEYMEVLQDGQTKQLIVSQLWSGISVSWGSIVGTLGNQTDLTNALAEKANVNGQVFTGNISATNLSGTNTGDQSSVSGNSGTATALQNARSIYGNSFDGTADLAQIIAAQFGGTGNGFTAFTGPAGATKTFTLPNASATILTTNAAVSAVQGGTGIATYTTGDILYASAANTLSKLAVGTNGHVLTLAAGVPTWAAGGGGGGGSWGSITGVLSNQTDLQTALDLKAGLGLNTFTRRQTITQGTANEAVIVSTGYSLTGSDATAMIDLAGTLNTSGSPTALKINLTLTGSGATTKFIDLLSSGTSLASISKTGKFTNVVNGAIGYEITVSGQPVVGFGRNGTVGGMSLFGGITTPSDVNADALIQPGLFLLASATGLSFSSGNVAQTPDLYLRRHAANSLIQRNSTSAQSYRIANTYTDSSNYELGNIEWVSNVLKIGTSKLGTGSARALELYTDGTTRLTISSAGAATFSSTLSATIFTGLYRLQTVTEASNAAPVTDINTYQRHTITALAANTVVGAPTGSPTDGQKLEYRIKDNATPRTVGWNAAFRSGVATLPTTTVTSKELYAMFEYNSQSSTWDCMATGSVA